MIIDQVGERGYKKFETLKGSTSESAICGEAF